MCICASNIVAKARVAGAAYQEHFRRTVTDGRTFAVPVSIVLIDTFREWVLVSTADPVCLTMFISIRIYILYYMQCAKMRIGRDDYSSTVLFDVYLDYLKLN